MIRTIGDKPFLKLSLFLVVVFALVVGSLSLLDSVPGRHFWSLQRIPHESDEASFSPRDDLEGADINLIQSARHSIDVAMYAFTDRRIEAALADAARRGVHVRVYRDALQFSDEESRAAKSGEASPTRQLHGLRGVEIRIKGESQSMHLKTFCVDGTTLRTGSANWSVSGETRQDNDLYVVSTPSVVKNFQTDFNALWSRPDNRDIN